MASETQWTVEGASAILQTLLAEEKEETVDSGQRLGFLKEFAVLVQFAPDAAAAKWFRADLVTLPRIPDEPQWYTLKPASREEGLRILGSLSAMQAARSRKEIGTPVLLQRVFDEFLAADYSAAESQDTQVVEAALQVVTWLGDFTADAPSRASLERRVAIRRLLFPMERLTRGFMGRQSELARLRTFVGVLEAQSRVEAVRKALASFQSSRSPLMLHGIGGTGKSTLLAEFIRQHVNSPVPFPWVYLDFDNPRLNVALLSTLVEEAVEQLRAQYAGSDWKEVLEASHSQSILVDAASYESEGATRTLHLGDVEFSENLRQDASQVLAQLFAAHLLRTLESSMLERMMGASQMLPLLIVLDTFEEVQKRGVEMARGLWRFLSALQKELPRVRIVVSGRAPVPELETYLASPDMLPLKEFDEDAAVSFLMARGVQSRDTARALYKQVGGNALNLKLAAQVAQLDPLEKGGIEGLKTSSYLIFAAAENVIQGQLYKRILDRIPNEDLQNLAHPGLVVRRVTRDIIRYVLAQPCGLGEIEDVRAGELFAALRQQVDLVTVEPDGGLRHQQDVRRVMLKMLEAERPLQVREIHERAFAYYQTQQGGMANIERLYHTLQLGKDSQEVGTIWNPEAGESLLSSVDELPPASQLVVYVMTKREPPAELRALADQHQWEILVEVRARRYLQYADYPQAEAVLRERADRLPASPLYAIEALLAMQMLRYDVAIQKLDLGTRSAEAVNRIDRLCELWRLRGEVLQRLGEFGPAALAMKTAQTLAMRMGAPAVALQICAERALLHEKAQTELPEAAELEALVKACADADFGQVRLQLRGLFRVCGPYSVPLLLKGLRVFKLQYVPEMLEGPEAWEMADQNRLNEYLQKLLERDVNNSRIRQAVALALEDGLDPRRSLRLL